MRLLMTTDTLGGVWTYSLELARALQPHGVEIALATMGRTLASDQRRAAESLDNVRVYESRYRLEWMELPWDDVAAAGSWLLDVAADCNPDLIHLNSYAHGVLDWPAPVLMVGHSCVFSWFQEVRQQSPGPEWDEYRAQVTAGLRSADLVVAPTRTMLHWLDEFYGPLGRMRVILNGREPRALSSLTKHPFILTAGRLWDEAKNVAALAAVAGDLPWTVYVAGEDRHPDGGGVSLDGVRLLGRLDEPSLARWYGRASIYVLPARYEPFGLTPLEAALAGCALVLGDIPTLREIWGDAACFVPPDDHHALAESLTDLAGNPARRRELIARSRSRARQLTPRRMADAYAAAYQELLEGPSRGTESHMVYETAGTRESDLQTAGKSRTVRHVTAGCGASSSAGRGTN